MDVHLHTYICKEHLMMNAKTTKERREKGKEGKEVKERKVGDGAIWNDPSA